MFQSLQMYSIVLLSGVIFSSSHLSDCKIIEEKFLTERQETNNLFYFPDGQGNLKLVDLQEKIDDKIISIDVKSVVAFYLITRENLDDPQILELGDEDSLRKSYFKVGKTTVFVSHGWQSAAKDMKDVAHELLINDDVNVINVDWSLIADKNYITAKLKTHEIGATVGDFVNWLVTRGVSYDEIHLVGISLGAQMMGLAGRQTGGKIKKITGLDPAGPLWYTDKHRLQSTDAQFVEIIHTNTVFYGYKYQCGDVDIYSDGGAIMPACASATLKNRCSHVISMNFFIVSLRYKDHFIAKECKSYAEARKQPCHGQQFVFGTNNLTKFGSGIYRMETKATYPY